MNIGGGLRYVTAPMGGGKSLYAVKRMMSYLIAGKYVITNVRLYDGSQPPEKGGPYDFATIAARTIARTRPGIREQVAERLRRYYIYEESLKEAIRYRVPGYGETRALMVWDEAHNDLNNRSYLKRGKNFESEHSGGDSLLEWATQLRKLGYEGILISQSHENTDAQLRRICNYIVRVQNQRETIRTPFLNSRMFFMPKLFLAYWYMTNTPAGSKQVAVKVERYFMGYAKDLYDTMDLYHGVGNDELVGNVIRLPEGGLTDEVRAISLVGRTDLPTIEPTGVILHSDAR
jgi:hypothetical protein